MKIVFGTKKARQMREAAEQEAARQLEDAVRNARPPTDEERRPVAIDDERPVVATGGPGPVMSEPRRVPPPSLNSDTPAAAVPERPEPSPPAEPESAAGEEWTDFPTPTAERLTTNGAPKPAPAPRRQARAARKSTARPPSRPTSSRRRSKARDVSG